jgi:hypothetical protein
MNDDVPARKAEGRTSFYAGKSAQSLYAQLGIKQAMASLHVVPRPLDKKIPTDNNLNSVREVETRDQDLPVVSIPECYARLFRTKTEMAAMAGPSDQSIKVIKEVSVDVMGLWSFANNHRLSRQLQRRDGEVYNY